MNSLDQVITSIVAELQQFEAFFKQTLKAETEPMDSIMHYVCETQGKRIRPILVLLSAKLFGIVNEQTLRAATFVEMLHSATIIHDDVVDGSDLRRGKASVKAQFGNLSAVLAGDYLLSKAMLLLAQPGDHAILQEMLNATVAMSEGELMQGSVELPNHGSFCDAKLQVQMPRCDNTTARYLDIITRKTAMLMRSCCVAGALSVNAAPEQVQQVSDFGLHFGILFQLRDDILDGENVEIAQVWLPTFLERTIQSLAGFKNKEIAETLRKMTAFCVERNS